MDNKCFILPPPPPRKNRIRFSSCSIKHVIKQFINQLMNECDDEHNYGYLVFDCSCLCRDYIGLLYV